MSSDGTGGRDIVGRTLLKYYERALAEHGPTPRGVGWMRAEDLATRFDVMMAVIRAPEARPSVLDLGCGPGLLLDHLAERGRIDTIDYTGLDLSARMVETARARWPAFRFLQGDILADPMPPQGFDYVVINGVLTLKYGLDQTTMLGFAERLIAAAFAMARIGIAFNLVSAHLDWVGEYLFHCPFDVVAQYLHRNLSDRYTIRADYGLPDYTVYLYRRPAP
jgi:SAM-dependent methyltransferase